MVNNSNYRKSLGSHSTFAPISLSMAWLSSIFGLSNRSSCRWTSDDCLLKSDLPMSGSLGDSNPPGNTPTVSNMLGQIGSMHVCYSQIHISWGTRLIYYNIHNILHIIRVLLNIMHDIPKFFQGLFVLVSITSTLPINFNFLSSHEYHQFSNV